MGANCTIVCGVTIGRYAFVGAGTVVNRNVPDHALVVGNPGARPEGEAPTPDGGINGRLDTVQAAILLEKLDLFPEECRLRWTAGKRYDDLLADVPGLQPPIIGEGNDPVYAQYTLLAEDRNALSQRLKASGIPAVAYYTAPLHLQGAFANLDHKPGDFPIAETIAARCLSLPMSPYLCENDQKKVSAAIKME